LESKLYLSIVSPVYKAGNIVNELVTRIEMVVSQITMNYEIILVEDASPDNSWQEIKKICYKNSKVKGIKLSRNFGQHYAISAGIAKSKGDNVVLMDCDLQDDPSDIVKLVEKRKEGFDIVFTKRKNRKHSFFKSFNSYVYNKIFSIFSDRKYDIDSGSYVLFSRRVAVEFNKLKDQDRLYLQMLKWLGFESTTIELEHKERFEGKSSYNFMSLVKLGVQGLTSHSDKLLRLSIYLGMVLSIISFIAGIYVIFRYFFYKLQPGWPSIIVSILFSTGLILFSVGIMGIYVGKIFEHAKNRPLYIIDEELNIDE
jgi:polyisoprenyl-phosphate glycosyltransferase